MRFAGFGRRAATALVMNLAAVLVMLGLSQPAMAGTSSTGSPGGLYWCTEDKPLCHHALTTFGANAGLNMVCWPDGRWAVGAYNSNRWFYVKMDDGREGFAHSSRIVRQTATPNCNAVRSVAAAQWAMDRDGQNIYVNLCLKFVRDAYLSTGFDIGSAATAHDHWAARSSWMNYSTNPPRGALVYWKGRPGYPEGHVAISLGNGLTVSTYERNTVPVHLMWISERNQTHGAWYGGWYMP